MALAKSICKAHVQLCWKRIARIRAGQCHRVAPRHDGRLTCELIILRGWATISSPKRCWRRRHAAILHRRAQIRARVSPPSKDACDPPLPVTKRLCGTQREPSAPAGVGTRQESRPQEESGARRDITFGRCGHEGGVYGKNLGIYTQYYPTHSMLLPQRS
jgi:hypothetical protein